jgi:hypothetical protein
MMITGRIWKNVAWWLAESLIADVMTQGKSRSEARAMLADAIESLVDLDTFEVTVKDDGVDGAVTIEASDPGALAALVLKRQRHASGLSLADVAKKLGQTSRNAYARYEQGRAVPTLDKFEQLLRVVAPDIGVTIAARSTRR